MESPDERQAALEEQKKNCIFCKIVAGKVSAKKVYDDADTVVVLDINPAAKGHMLVVPKEHYPILPLVPAPAFDRLALLVRTAATAAREAMLMQGATVFVANGGAAGQQSQHFLIHVIPREEGDGIDALDIPSNPISPEENARIAEDMRQAIGALVQRHYQQTKKRYPGRRAPMPTEKLVSLIEQNKPLLDAVLADPAAFKRLVPTHPQLKEIFAGADVDAVIKAVQDKHGKRPSAPAPSSMKKEEKKEARKDADGKKKDEAEDVFEALRGGVKKDDDDTHKDHHDGDVHGHDDDRGHAHDHDGDDGADGTDLDEISRLFR